jgi:signal transduction histidine kinase
MLKLNKLERQTISPVPEPYDLCQQLCECALLFEASWKNKDIKFIAEIEDYATINADASLFEIVWNNLLSNAVKFTENGGKITLKQTSENNSVTVTI